MYTACKVKLNPTKKQKVYFNQNIGASRWIYNYMLDYCIKHYDVNKDLPKEEQEKRPSSFDLQKLIKPLKIEYPWLVDCDSQALKFAVAQVDVAFKNFFRRIKQGVSPGYPKFKSKYTSRQSFTLTQGQRIFINEKTIRLPKIGDVFFNTSDWRAPENGVIKSATISKTKTDKYYISVMFQTEEELPEPIKIFDKNQITVVDLGLKTLCKIKKIGQPINIIESPRFLRVQLKKLKKTYKEFSRKQKDSNRREKIRNKIARLYERISAKRSNYYHTITSRLVTESECIVIDDLSIKDMMADKTLKGRKRHNINRAFSDQSLGEFISMLNYKCEKNGKVLIKVPASAKTSKTCNNCQSVNEFVEITTDDWQCENCDAIHNRTENSINNLFNYSVALLEIDK